jgi:hypothetical protein
MLQVLALAGVMLEARFGGSVPNDSLGLPHASAFPLGGLLVVGCPLHIANQALFFAELFESPNHLLHGLA